MGDMETVLTLFTVISLFLSFSSIFALGFIIHSLNKRSIERSLLLDSKEFALLQQQYSFLLVKVKDEQSRLDSIEKFVSALIVSGYAGDGDGGGISH